MNKIRASILSILLVVSALFVVWQMYSVEPLGKGKMDRLEKMHAPSDHFFLVRTFPDKSLDLRAVEEAIEKTRHNESIGKRENASLPWSQEGPGNIGGRINSIAINPNNSNEMFLGAPAGGIFKTLDGGQSWNPVFDEQPFLSIGDIAYDPNNTQTIYAGTGDLNISGYPFIGNGVYKSQDGGITWDNIGLEDTRVISEIIVDPNNSDIIYAGAMGLPMERNQDRGLYKTIDGGLNWSNVLYINDSTGICDIMVNPTNSDIIFAASWSRIRNNQETVTNSTTARIHKSMDGGQTWTIIWNGIPDKEVSRIGLEMSGTDPSKVFCVVVDSSQYLLGIYRSDNEGDDWVEISTPSLKSDGPLAGFGWYFGKIHLNPWNHDEIYLDGVNLFKTEDGGLNWFQADPPWWEYSVHADKHDLVFIDSTTFIIATDGGAYRSDDNGDSYTDIENIPITQFYRVGINPHRVGTYWGGAQDNGTCSGNSSFMNQWTRDYGGDGFQMLFDPNNEDVMVFSSQWGNFVYSDDGGYYLGDFTGGISGGDRVNWDAPIINSHHSSNVYYSGTHRVYKASSGAGSTWDPISPDLTDGVVFGEKFHTLSTIDESSRDPNWIYTGSSDGNIYRTLNGGQSWDNISTGLPKRYVTCIKSDDNNDQGIYVSHSGYKYNDYIPHLHKSNDYGASWIDISGDLPQFGINDFEVYSEFDSLIVAATDGGVFITQNAGQNWVRLGNNMPFIPVYDVEIDTFSRKIIAGTFARSLQSYPLDSLLSFPTVGIETAPVKQEKRHVESYPNPAQNFIDVKLPLGVTALGMEVKVLDLSGKEVMKPYTLGTSKRVFRVPLESLSTGLYVMKLTGNRQVFSSKFFKQ